MFSRSFAKNVLILLPVLMVVAATVEKTYFEATLGDEISSAENAMGTTAWDPDDDGGTVETIASGGTLTGKQMRSVLEDDRSGSWTGYRMFSIGSVERATACAVGTDREYHFVNAFLEGYSPFFTEEVWIPMYVVSMRLAYLADTRQFGGLRDIWQTSRQAFMNTRGDCEDHAIVLADWLETLGYDARVVVGRIDSGGHAWVVVDVDGKMFLLEATSKKKRRNWSHYPLASLVRGYFPLLMFDRESFWLNTGSESTNSYTGPHWDKRSRFIE